MMSGNPFQKERRWAGHRASPVWNGLTRRPLRRPSVSFAEGWLVSIEAPIRLVAILAADVESYSRLMALDEEAALGTLSAHRAIADELIAAFRGRIANTAGDSVLAEFASVVDAVRCVIEIQDKIASANGELLEARQMLFRIGINVGDVMVKNGDIFGDGVNVAARLQTLATAGGICVSRGVRDSIRHLAGVCFEDLGEQVVKNIARPVRAFRVTIDQEAAAEETEETAPPEPTGISTDRTALDLAMGQTVQDSGDVEGFLHYLQRFPEGEFAEIARDRITALSRGPSEPSEIAVPAVAADIAVELTFWESVRDSDNPEMYEAYLEKDPDGEFVPLAKVRLEELRQQQRCAP
jgi:adenylate cyclase